MRSPPIGKKPVDRALVTKGKEGGAIGRREQSLGLELQSAAKLFGEFPVNFLDFVRLSLPRFLAYPIEQLVESLRGFNCFDVMHNRALAERFKRNNIVKVGHIVRLRSEE